MTFMQLFYKYEAFRRFVWNFVDDDGSGGT